MTAILDREVEGRVIDDASLSLYFPLLGSILFASWRMSNTRLRLYCFLLPFASTTGRFFFRMTGITDFRMIDDARLFTSCPVSDPQPVKQVPETLYTGCKYSDWILKSGY